MLTRTLFTLLLIAFSPSLIVAQQSSETCPSPIEYEDHNQITLSPLSFRSVTGKVIDQDGIAIPTVCLELFTEENHQLVSSSVTDDDGYFSFRGIRSGIYRLVAKDNYNGFCTANVRIQIVRWPRGGIVKRKRLVIHLRVAGVDSCSYGDYK